MASHNRAVNTEEHATGDQSSLNRPTGCSIAPGLNRESNKGTTDEQIYVNKVNTGEHASDLSSTVEHTSDSDSTIQHQTNDQIDRGQKRKFEHDTPEQNSQLQNDLQQFFNSLSMEQHARLRELVNQLKPQNVNQNRIQQTIRHVNHELLRRYTQESNRASISRGNQGDVQINIQVEQVGTGSVPHHVFVDHVDYCPVRVFAPFQDGDIYTYRIIFKDTVRYVIMRLATFDDNDMFHQPSVESFLRSLLPSGVWNKAYIARNGTKMHVKGRTEELPGVVTDWNLPRVDVITLATAVVKRYNAEVFTTKYGNEIVVAKIAAIPQHIKYMENEEKTYRLIEQAHQAAPELPRIAPRVLAHITEHGRVIGLLLEEIKGAAPDAPLKGSNGSESFEVAMRFGKLGIFDHIRDPSKWIIEEGSGHYKRIDFEQSNRWSDLKHTWDPIDNSYEAILPIDSQACSIEGMFLPFPPPRAPDQVKSYTLPRST